MLVGFLFPCFKCIKPGLKPCSCSDQWQSSHFTLLPSRLVPGTRSIQKPPRALMAQKPPRALTGVVLGRIPIPIPTGNVLCHLFPAGSWDPALQSPSREGCRALLLSEQQEESLGFTFSVQGAAMLEAGGCSPGSQINTSCPGAAMWDCNQAATRCQGTGIWTGLLLGGCLRAS